MLQNRGEAIDHLMDLYEGRTQIFCEQEARLSIDGLMKAWLFRSEGMPMSVDEDELQHWLLEDGTEVTTSVFRPSISSAYAAARERQQRETQEFLND